MSYFVECFAWCMLQVGGFSLVAATLYWLVRRRVTSSLAEPLVTSLAIVGALTLWSVSPWPQWDCSNWSAQHQRIGDSVRPSTDTIVPNDEPVLPDAIE